MRDGVYLYDLDMTVPLGRRSGRLELRIGGEKVSGFLTMFTTTLPILPGTCLGNRISFAGKMQTLMSTIPYVAEGVISRSGLELTFRTDIGEYSATGRQRIASQRRSKNA